MSAAGEMDGEGWIRRIFFYVAKHRRLFWHGMPPEDLPAVKRGYRCTRETPSDVFVFPCRSIVSDSSVAGPGCGFGTQETKEAVSRPIIIMLCLAFEKKETQFNKTLTIVSRNSWYFRNVITFIFVRHLASLHNTIVDRCDNYSFTLQSNMKTCMQTSICIMFCIMFWCTV